MKTRIYSLRDEVGLTRYIGKTIKPLDQRLVQHVWVARSNAHNHHCSNWIRSMIDKGHRPTIHLIEECDGDGCGQEVMWIAMLRFMGWPLVNSTIGGEGVLGMKHTEATKAMWSAKRKGQQLGRVFSQETRRKISEKHKGKTIPEWHRARIGAASRLRTGTPVSEATRQKLRDRVFTPQWRAKIGMKSRGRKFSPESRAKMSASAKERCLREKSEIPLPPVECV